MSLFKSVVDCCSYQYTKMIVVKEEQGSGEWVRNGDGDPNGGYGRQTMLKEDMPPNLPPDHHPLTHNNNNNNNNGHNHNGNGNNNNNNSNNNNNNSPPLANHNHHGSAGGGMTGVSSCANSGQGHHHPHGPNNNNNNNNNSSCNNGGGGNGGSGNNICSGCGQRILDRYYVLAVDRQWHNVCLKCHSCGVVLSNQLTCFARDGLILCKDDYYRTYQQLPRRACARCGHGIGSHELIMRAKDLVYHLNCFVCVVCQRVLNKGDHFGMRNSALYCQKHYEMVLDENSASSPPPPHMTPNSPHHHNAHHHTPPHHPAHPASAFFNGAGSGQKGRPRKRKEPNVDGNMGSIIELGATTPPAMQHVTHNLDLLGEPGSGHHLSGPRLEGYDSSSSTSCPTGVTGSQRTKRMRTSFKHHQLRTMKSYFAINQNPDAKDLKQLAQKTGLSKRVLQVWFQNARAKWRRNMLRTESSGTTPTRDDEMQMNAGSIASGALDILSGGGGSDDGGFSSDVY